MQTASSANRTCRASRSASEYTATVRTPSSLQAQMILSAISPRLAIRIFWNIGVQLLCHSPVILSEAKNLGILDSSKYRDSSSPAAPQNDSVPDFFYWS